MNEPLSFMKDGTELYIDGYLDSDGEAEIEIDKEDRYGFYVNKAQAIEMVKHLTKIFKLGDSDGG